MVVHTCPNCKKEFNKKSNYDRHIENKKKSCVPINNIVPQKSSEFPHKTSEIPHKPENLPLIKEDIIDLILKKTMLNDANNDNINKNLTCMYCDKLFTRNDNLQRHQNSYCKSKANHDELEILKEKMNIIIGNYQNLENNYQNLENNFQNLENNYQQLINTNQNEGKIINNNANKKIINTNNSNNNNNNNINNGIVNNINIVQFGEEDISKLNLPEALKQYLISTGGNITSNMLKYINLNEKYPENNNICISDMSRELVKIHNGKKFIIKKFKNVKNDIVKNVVKNTRKIVDNYEQNDNFKKSADVKTKLKINEVSLKLIDGISGEEIVREEIKEKEKLLNLKNNLKNNSKKDIDNSEDDDSESEEERDFTFEERLRIEHLDKKREGLQIKTFEILKEDLYNARSLLP